MDTLRFKKKKILLIPLVLITILLILMSISEFPDYDSSTILFLVLGIPVFTMGWVDYFRFKVCLDDEGISYRGIFSNTYMKWTEVEKVTVADDFSNIFKALLLLRHTMLGLTRITVVLSYQFDRIILQSDIANFTELVGFMKDKLGSKFDTSNLPIAYKPILVKYTDIKNDPK